MHAYRTVHRPNVVILTSLLKAFDLFTVNYDYRKTGGEHCQICIAVQCVIYKQVIYFKIDNIRDKDHIIVFIKYIIFRNVGS